MDVALQDSSPASLMITMTLNGRTCETTHGW